MSETVLREQNSLSLVSQTSVRNIGKFIWRSIALDCWCENPFLRTNLDSWMFERAESGREEALRLSRDQNHRDLGDKNSFHKNSTFYSPQHTWPDDEGVEVAPEDEVVVPPPVVDLHDAGGAGEQPGLARTIESLTHSRRVWQKRPKDFLKCGNYLTYASLVWIVFTLTWSLDWMTRREGPSWSWQFL